MRTMSTFLAAIGLIAMSSIATYADDAPMSQQPAPAASPDPDSAHHDAMQRGSQKMHDKMMQTNPGGMSGQSGMKMGCGGNTNCKGKTNGMGTTKPADKPMPMNDM